MRGRSSSAWHCVAPTPKSPADSVLCLIAAVPDIRAGMSPPADWLTHAEATRLQGRTTSERRDTFLAGRWLARLALQRWSGIKELPALGVADSGACTVLDISGAHVSITHSAGVVAVAACALPIGVDLEKLTPVRDYMALAEVVHSPAQRTQLASLEGRARALAFLQAWTAKEAWLKARGQGLDFAIMQSLAFDEDDSGDVALTCFGEFALALATHTTLPRHIVGLPSAQWQRSRSRRLA